MRNTIVFTAEAAVLIVGCAAPKRDTSQLRSEIEEAQAGDFGQCLENLSNAADQLGEAKKVLNMAEKSWVSDSEYERGLQAASKGSSYRRYQTLSLLVWPVKILPPIEDPVLIGKILAHLGLPTRAPPQAPAQSFDLFETA